jgi:ApaG protein
MDRLEDGFRLSIETGYIEGQSRPSEHRYVFAYTITITNDGEVPARLLNRHWIVTHGNGKSEEVRGKGVVGEQPRIPPGESFSYTSGAVIETEVGAMQGSYEFEADGGSHFDVPIPPFTLSVPNALH